MGKSSKTKKAIQNRKNKKQARRTSRTSNLSKYNHKPLKLTKKQELENYQQMAVDAQQAQLKAVAEGTAQEPTPPEGMTPETMKKIVAEIKVTHPDLDNYEDLHRQKVIQDYFNGQQEAVTESKVADEVPKVQE